MSYGGTETYAVNTGQVTQYRDPTSNPTTLIYGTPASGVTPSSGYASGFYCISRAGDLDPSAYVAGTWVSSTTPGGTNLFTNFEIGWAQSNGNYIMADNSDLGGSITGGDILLVIGGTHHPLPGSSWTAGTPLPPNSRVALGLVGNTATVWTYVAGVWSQVATGSTAGIYDFTVTANRVGWWPFIGQSSQPNTTTQVFSLLQWGPFSELTNNGFNPPDGFGGAVLAGPAIQLSWNSAVPLPGNPLTEPVGYNLYRNGVLLANITTLNQLSYIDSTVLAGVSYTYTVTAANPDLSDASGLSLPVVISTSPVFVYGRFVPAATYVAFELTNTKGIEPRIWRPNNNTKFRA